MCERRKRSPEKYMSSHFPCAATFSMVLPTTPWPSSTRVRCGKADSKEVTVCPPSARFKVRDARQMVSPSGISRAFLNFWSVFVFGILGWMGANNERLGATHLITQNGIHEASIFQVGR